MARSAISPLSRLLLLVLLAVVLAADPRAAFAGSSIGLTDVSGGAGDCVTPVRDAVCATLFDGTSPLFPGGPAQVRQVRITYSGDRPATSLGLFTQHLVSRAPQSQASCTAPDPASRLEVVVSDRAAPVFSGSLAALARDHGASPEMLRLPSPRGSQAWTSGDTQTYTIAVALDATAGNAYMGCVSTADVVWLAAQ